MWEYIHRKVTPAKFRYLEFHDRHIPIVDLGLVLRLSVDLTYHRTDSPWRENISVSLHTHYTLSQFPGFDTVQFTISRSCQNVDWKSRIVWLQTRDTCTQARLDVFDKECKNAARSCLHLVVLNSPRIPDVECGSC